MKIFIFGGQKSGKTSVGMNYAKQLANKKKPIYIATYDNSYGDKSMQKRVRNHQKQREKSFKSKELSKDLHKYLKPNKTYIIDCMSMWLLNHIELSQKKIIKELKKILKSKANIVFVLNDISSGVIPVDSLSRKYVDLSGIIGQLLSKHCDKVVRVDYGLQTKLK
jgi:adenosylcobinamide kinase/adenosylcobinamide-phosphate guanylyltransferase